MHECTPYTAWQGCEYNCGTTLVSEALAVLTALHL
jgi:hypothetical protein